MTRDEVIKKVQAKMNEISPFDSGDIVNDGLVSGMVDETTRNVLLQAPLSILPYTDANKKANKYSNDPETGYVEKPSDYIKLASFQMSDWKRKVTQPITPEHPLYKRQSYKHLRGGTAKPIVVELGDKLEYYSTKADTHSINEFKYIAETKPENLTNQKLLDVITWQCAGDCFVILLETEVSKLAYQKAAETLKQ